MFTDKEILERVWGEISDRPGIERGKSSMFGHELCYKCDHFRWCKGKCTDDFFFVDRKTPSYLEGDNFAFSLKPKGLKLPKKKKPRKPIKKCTPPECNQVVMPLADCSRPTDLTRWVQKGVGVKKHISRPTNNSNEHILISHPTKPDPKGLCYFHLNLSKGELGFPETGKKTKKHKSCSKCKKRQKCIDKCTPVFRRHVIGFREKNNAHKILNSYSLTKKMCPINLEYVNQDYIHSESMSSFEDGPVLGNALDTAPVSFEELFSARAGWATIKGLSKLQNDVVNLFYGDGNQSNEIAFILSGPGKSINTTKVRNTLQAAKRRLKKLHPDTVSQSKKPKLSIPYGWAEFIDTLPSLFPIEAEDPIKDFPPKTRSNTSLPRIDRIYGTDYATFYNRRKNGKEYPLYRAVRRDRFEKIKQLYILNRMDQFFWKIGFMPRNDPKRLEDEANWKSRIYYDPNVSIFPDSTALDTITKIIAKGRGIGKEEPKKM